MAVPSFLTQKNVRSFLKIVGRKIETKKYKHEPKYQFLLVVRRISDRFRILFLILY